MGHREQFSDSLAAFETFIFEEFIVIYKRIEICGQLSRLIKVLHSSEGDVLKKKRVLFTL